MKVELQGGLAEDAATRPLRADALLNRGRILDAAEEVFEQEGVNAQVDAIAERAGVGVGTLYRHFPTKEALIEAVIRARLNDLIERASNCDANDPGCAFFSFLEEFAGHAASKRGLFEALGGAGDEMKARCENDFSLLRQAVARLLRSAQDHGAVRPDVTGDDVIGLVVGTCHGVGHDTNASARLSQMIRVVIDGLRVSPAPAQ